MVAATGNQLEAHYLHLCEQISREKDEHRRQALIDELAALLQTQWQETEVPPTPETRSALRNS